MVRYRPMRHRDIAECVRIVATHPILGPRYGDAIKDLPSAWRCLLDGEWFFSTAVFEEAEGTRLRILGCGISVFATDEFVREAKTSPYFWLAPELTRRIAGGDPPLLTEKQVSDANSRGGLNLVVWQASFHPREVARAELWDVTVGAFLQIHRGYRLKELIIQAETSEHLMGMLNSGSRLHCDVDGTWSESRQVDPQRVIMKPHLVGLTREIACRQVGSWVGTLFLYQPPQLGFSRSEQRLLWAALRGQTDEELSDSLGVSLSAIKKTWRAIYARVTDQLPVLIPNVLSEEVLTQDRGKEKRRRLIAYLREHPEELRPVSRKLLQITSAANMDFPNRRSSPGPGTRLSSSRNARK